MKSEAEIALSHAAFYKALYDEVCIFLKILLKYFLI